MFLPLKGVHINNFSMHRNIMFFEKHVDRFFSENNDTTQENCETLQLVINAWMPKAYTFLLFTFFEFISTIIRWHRYSFPHLFHIHLFESFTRFHTFSLTRNLSLHLYLLHDIYCISSFFSLDAIPLHLFVFSWNHLYVCVLLSYPIQFFCGLGRVCHMYTIFCIFHILLCNWHLLFFWKFKHVYL